MVEPPVMSASTLEAGFLRCRFRLEYTIARSSFELSFTESASFVAGP